MLKSAPKCAIFTFEIQNFLPRPYPLLCPLNSLPIANTYGSATDYSRTL